MQTLIKHRQQGRARWVVFVLASVMVGALLGGCGKETKLQITNIEPKEGPIEGGETVVLDGTGFSHGGAKGAQVYFGRTAGRVLRFEGDSKLYVESPTGQKGETVDVSLVFDDSRQFTYPKAYTYIVREDIKVDDLVGGGENKEE